MDTESPLGGRVAQGRTARCGTVLGTAGHFQRTQRQLLPAGARGPLLITRNPVSQNQNGPDSLKLRDGRLRCDRNMAELTST